MDKEDRVKNIGSTFLMDGWMNGWMNEKQQRQQQQQQEDPVGMCFGGSRFHFFPICMYNPTPFHEEKRFCNVLLLSIKTHAAYGYDSTASSNRIVNASV